MNRFASTLRDGRLGIGVLTAALAVGAALRLWLSFNDDGIFWPDEITQSLEPAHRLVFGYGFISRDFAEGIRNWTFPALCAALLKLSTLVGLSEPRGYLALTRIAFSVLSVATAYACYHLARSFGASALPAACGAALFALTAPFIYFAPRAMSEAPSGLLITLGFSFALRPSAREWDTRIGASLLGLATLVRMQNGLFCVGLLCILATRKRWSTVLEAGLVLAGWAFAYALIDRLTWGDWFHSAVAYVRNSLEPKAWLAPIDFYGRGVWTSMRWAGVTMFALSPLAIGRTPGLFLTAGAYLVLHTAIEHKEFRYILPVAPLYCALAGIGLDLVLRRCSRVLYIVLVVALLAAAIVSAVSFRNLTFGDLGEFRRIKPSASAYDESGPVNRLLLSAYEQPDLCGLKVEVMPLVWTGGYTYLHRPVPFYPDFGPSQESGYFNYTIVTAKRGQPGEIIATQGSFALIRLHHGGCVPDVTYNWRLP